MICNLIIYYKSFNRTPLDIGGTGFFCIQLQLLFRYRHQANPPFQVARTTRICADSIETPKGGMIDSKNPVFGAHSSIVALVKVHQPNIFVNI